MNDQPTEDEAMEIARALQKLPPMADHVFAEILERVGWCLAGRDVPTAEAMTILCRASPEARRTALVKALIDLQQDGSERAYTVLAMQARNRMKAMGLEMP